MWYTLRPIEPPDDFLLLSPLDPFGEFGDYQCYSKKLHFFFCRTCGVRPFIFAGDGEIVEVDPAEARVSVEGSEASGNETVKAWRPRRGPDSKFDGYLSVNGHTIDAKQKGFDMRVLTEKKHVLYCDGLSEPEGPSSYERPGDGGCY